MPKPDVKPTRPFIIMNRHYVWKPHERWNFQKIGAKAFDNGRFKEKAFIIDANCRHFEVLDVINVGLSWWPFDLLSKRKIIRFRYVLGPPIQLTFDDARRIFVEHVCSRGWWSASYENEAQFRTRNAIYTNMHDLLEPVFYKGKWVL